MKIRSVRIALALGLLCAVGVFFACTTAPENGNRATNQNKAVNANLDQPAIARMTAACQEPDLGNRRSEVETTLTGNFANWPRAHWNLKVQVVDDKNLRVLIGGAIDTASLTTLESSVKPLMQPDCVISVYFVKKGTVTSAANTVDTKPPYIPLEDFRWGGCEGDLQMCPDGSCNLTCPKPHMSPTPGTKGDTNLDVDANTKSNSNSNSNRAP